MKHLLWILLLSFTVGCASLPETNTTGVSHLAVPIFATNESTQPGFGYHYVVRLINQTDGSERTVILSPNEGLRLTLIKDLTPGEYCFDGYFSRPARERGTNYTYQAELKPYKSCLTLKANTLTVWQNKVQIRKWDDEKKDNSRWQNHQFLTLEPLDKIAIREKFDSYKNIELWKPIQWASD